MPQKFCEHCGAALAGGAKFCVECGAPVDGVATPSAPRRANSEWIATWAPALVLVGVAAIGGGAVLFGSMTAKPPPNVPPRSAPAQNAASQQELPQNHPPLELPEDIRKRIEEIVAEAEAKPDDASLWVKAGNVLYRAGQVDPKYFVRASDAFAKVIAREPENLDALRALGNIAYDQEKYDEARARYESYLKLKPDDLMVKTDLGTVYLGQKDAKKAISAYEDVLKTDPKFFQAQYNLAIAYHSAGDPERAKLEMAKAREAAPDDVTRQQIDTMLARVSGQAAAPAPEAAADESEPESPREKVEAIFRKHPITASKVDRIDWPDDTTARVVLRKFPMDSMPPFARDKFLGRIREGVVAAGGGVKKVELVDVASGRVMATVDAAAPGSPVP